MERKLLLLGMLRMQDMHGYQLNEMIDSHIQAGFALKKPTMYKLLNAMVEDGWLTCATHKEGNYPTRRVYSLTAAGELAFMKLLRDSLSAYSPIEYQGNVSLLFMNALPEDERMALLHRRREIVKSLQHAMHPLPAISNPHDLVQLHQIRHLETELAWLDEVIASVSEERIHLELSQF
ncbi:MAG: PadR family transcriptional regulator [Chloroflexi bacterium]|nr:PadR family transcriptional regulator [Chloroflexota bacterium]